ncbi:MAG TPA: hypothetical protein VKB12_21150, partial [Pyrinomonadaceae bacterium]|nr:hypothetical protein [Pyrinomonadaceae bacterium]
MHYAKLAALLTPLLVESQQSVLNVVAWRLTLFVIFAVILSLFAASCVAFLTLFFGSFAVPSVLGVQWLYRMSVQH